MLVDIAFWNLVSFSRVLCDDISNSFTFEGQIFKSLLRDRHSADHSVVFRFLAWLSQDESAATVFFPFLLQLFHDSCRILYWVFSFDSNFSSFLILSVICLRLVSLYLYLLLLLCVLLPIWINLVAPIWKSIVFLLLTFNFCLFKRWLFVGDGVRIYLLDW